MRHLLFTSLSLSCLLLVSACATKPFDASAVSTSVTPQQVINQPQQNSGKTVLWGGTILDTRNLTEYTQLEILAYPLDSHQRPVKDREPLGRFYIRHKGYLEPQTYTQGREVSVLGIISKLEQGKIGESSYSYPVIQSRQLHLWEKDDGKSRSSFHFGIGIGL